MAIGRVNTGGGGSGGTLTVTGVAGDTVTASKDGKTYTRTINSSGVAVFKGLATGTWTVKMTNGAETSTRTVTITADYALTIAYFSATITITYPASSTCTVTDSSGATVASDSNTGSSAKTWTATVSATGTYTITATNGSQTTSKSVSITTEGQVESVTLSFELVLFSGSENWTLKQRVSGYGSKSVSNNAMTLTGSKAYGSSDTPYSCSAFYPSKVAKSSYTTLKATVTAVTGSSNVYLMVQTDMTANASGEGYTAYVNISGTGTFSVPYPDGSYYVGLTVGGTSSVTVSKVWLE